MKRSTGAVRSAVVDHINKFNPPWLVVGWFHWTLFRPELAGQFRRTLSALMENQNWRYIRFDWANGEWAYHFINQKAKLRWKQRQKRQKKNLEKRQADGDVR